MWLPMVVCTGCCIAKEGVDGDSNPGPTLQGQTNGSGNDSGVDELDGGTMDPAQLLRALTWWRPPPSIH